MPRRHFYDVDEVKSEELGAKMCTVRITFPRLSETNTESYSRMAVKQALKSQCNLDEEDILVLGFLRRSNEFEVVLASPELRERVESHEYIHLEDKRKGKTSVIIPGCFTLRLLWLPAYMPDDVIIDTIQRNTPCDIEVKKIVFDQDLAECKNNNRMVTVRCANREAIPLVMSFQAITDRKPIDGLLSVPGKIPQCLRCGQKKHVRKECKIQPDDPCWCLICKRDAGHSTVNHKATVADVVAGVQNDRRVVEDDVIEDDPDATLDVSGQSSTPGAAPTSDAGTLPGALPGASPQRDPPHPPPPAVPQVSTSSTEVSHEDTDSQNEQSQSQSILQPPILGGHDPFASQEATPKPNQEHEKRMSRKRPPEVSPVKVKRPAGFYSASEPLGPLTIDTSRDGDSSETPWKSTADDGPYETWPEGFDPTTGQQDWDFSEKSRSSSPSPSRSPINRELLDKQD